MDTIIVILLMLGSKGGVIFEIQFQNVNLF